MKSFESCFHVFYFLCFFFWLQVKRDIDVMRAVIYMFDFVCYELGQKFSVHVGFVRYFDLWRSGLTFTGKKIGIKLKN